MIDSIFASDLAVNGVSTTADGQRTFMVVQPGGPSQPQVVEVIRGQAVPYPDPYWNAWSSDRPVATRFIGVNSLRIGPDAGLWLVDRGRAGYGEAWVPGAARLLRFDPATGGPPAVFDLAGACTQDSFVDDVRFAGDFAYLTDAGRPGLIVVDLKSTRAWRVLDQDPSTVARSPLMADGSPLRTPGDEPVVIHADQLEVSPDGSKLYYQPCSGGMSVVPTRFLTDPGLVGQAPQHVAWFADTPSTGGTAMDAAGRIYLSDVNQRRILRIDVDGSITVLLQDERLSWVDAMWIDARGRLIMPAAQLHLTAGLHGGVDEVQSPIQVYATSLDARPLLS